MQKMCNSCNGFMERGQRVCGWCGFADRGEAADSRTYNFSETDARDEDQEDTEAPTA